MEWNKSFALVHHFSGIDPSRVTRSELVPDECVAGVIKAATAAGEIIAVTGCDLVVPDESYIDRIDAVFKDYPKSERPLELPPSNDSPELPRP